MLNPGLNSFEESRIRDSRVVLETREVREKDQRVATSKRDFEYTTELNSFFLRPIGMWPSTEKAGVVESFFIKVQTCCCYFLILFLLLPCALHTFLIEQDPGLRLRMIGPLSFCMMAVMKLSFLVLRRNGLADCLAHIAADWENVRSSREREIMLEEAKFGRFVAGMCAVFMYSGGFFYHTIMPLSSGVVFNPNNNRSIRPLTYPVYEPLIDAQTSPNYEIVFATQWFSGFVMYTITIGACSIAAIFAMHACGQFKILACRLGKLVDGDDGSDTVEERTADVVELHLRALRLISSVEGVLNEVCFVEFIGCTMNICFLGYYFMTEWEQSETINTVTYCVLLVSFTFNILIFCYIGEMVTEQSERIGTMTYMIDWYKLRETKARGLILVLIIAKYPARITAGKMAVLSMTCFSNVLKTAITYLNLLRTVAN